MSLIFSHLDAKIARDVAHVSNSKELMEVIKNNFEKKGPTDALDTLRKLINLKYHKDGNLQNHIAV